MPEMAFASTGWISAAVRATGVATVAGFSATRAARTGSGAWTGLVAAFGAGSAGRCTGVSTATVSKSAAQAKELMFLRAGDGITMNRDRLLTEAKAKALALAEGYHPPTPPEFKLPGEGGHVGLNMAAQAFRKRGLATDYDLIVSDSLATVLTGGEADVLDTVSEADLLALERQEFARRVRDARTVARIETMLETGKPLRN